MEGVIEWFGLVFVMLNLITFIVVALVYGSRIYAVMQIPEAIKTRLIEDYERAEVDDLDDEVI